MCKMRFRSSSTLITGTTSSITITLELLSNQCHWFGSNKFSHLSNKKWLFLRFRHSSKRSHPSLTFRSPRTEKKCRSIKSMPSYLLVHHHQELTWDAHQWAMHPCWICNSTLNPKTNAHLVEIQELPANTPKEATEIHLTPSMKMKARRMRRREIKRQRTKKKRTRTNL